MCRRWVSRWNIDLDSDSVVMAHMRKAPRDSIVGTVVIHRLAACHSVSSREYIGEHHGVIRCHCELIYLQTCPKRSTSRCCSALALPCLSSPPLSTPSSPSFPFSSALGFSLLLRPFFLSITHAEGRTSGGFQIASHSLSTVHRYAREQNIEIPGSRIRWHGSYYRSSLFKASAEGTDLPVRSTC